MGDEWRGADDAGSCFDVYCSYDARVYIDGLYGRNDCPRWDLYRQLRGRHARDHDVRHRRYRCHRPGPRTRDARAAWHRPRWNRICAATQIALTLLSVANTRPRPRRRGFCFEYATGSSNAPRLTVVGTRFRG